MKDQIKEAIEYKDLNVKDLSDAQELIEALDYDGTLHEIVDGNIDHSYYELRKWAVDCYEFVEEAMEEGLCEGVTDFHKLIQCGQYVALMREAVEACEELFEEMS